MPDAECLFCEIASGKSPSVKPWENKEFMAIENIYPKAPVHLLVMPKEHVGKQMLAGVGKVGFWERMMAAVFEVIRLKGLDKTGYKLVNNGAGYNHFDHEHVHVLGGTSQEPGGVT